MQTQNIISAREKKSKHHQTNIVEMDGLLFVGCDLFALVLLCAAADIRSHSPSAWRRFRRHCRRCWADVLLLLIFCMNCCWWWLCERGPMICKCSVMRFGMQRVWFCVWEKRTYALYVLQGAFNVGKWPCTLPDAFDIRGYAIMCPYEVQNLVDMKFINVV